MRYLGMGMGGGGCCIGRVVDRRESGARRKRKSFLGKWNEVRELGPEVRDSAP